MGARARFADAAGVGWEVYRDAQSGADYFYNTETRESTWRDPRRAGARDPLTGARTLRSNLPYLAGLGLLFFGLVFAAVGARVRWLRRHRPGLLHPTEKKKVRRPKRPRASRGFTPGSRNRMSQDGKGGRSANS